MRSLLAQRVCLVSTFIAGVLAGVPRAAHAQGPITLTAGTTSPVLVAPSGKFTVPVILDMSLAGGSDVASLAFSITWASAQLSLDSIRPGGFGSLTSNASAGNALLALFSSTGTTATTTIANLYFTAAAGTAGTQVQLNATTAGNGVGASVFAQLGTRGSDVCVAPIGSWGDASGDGGIDIIDALQIARFSVGLSVTNAAALAAQGDVNGDGSVDIIDAQQIARFTVGLSAPARTATPLPLAPAVATVLVSPATPGVGIGQGARLTATPRDVQNTPLTGCAAVTWASSNAAVATVSAAGLVTGVALGSATITATSNGKTGSSVVTTFTPVASVAVAPDTSTIPMGTPVQLVPVLRDASNNVMSGQAITYTSSDTGVATVSATGLVTTKTVGPVSITTTSGGASFVSRLQVSPLAVNSLAVGYTHGCALDVTGAAYCWGGNGSGQLGNGTQASSGVPVQVAVTPGLRFTQIAAGGNDSCAISTQHDLYCWGAVPAGATSNTTSTPVLVSSPLRVQSAGVTAGISCMLTPAGSAYCAGINAAGQLGTGDSAASAVPRAVAGGLVFQSIGLGLFGPCGLTTSGAAYCWGNNQARTLGIATAPANSPLPAAVTGGLTFTSLTSGALLTCGVVAGGTGYCWGTADWGADGVGTTTNTNHIAPTAIATAVTFRTVVPGTGNDTFDGICGLGTDGSAYCWGNNFSGQVGSSAALPGSCTSGTSTFPCTGVPTAVTTTSKFNVISVGQEQVCGLTTTHTLVCWGANASGQLGDNTTTNRSTPVTVLGNLRLP